MEDQILTNNNNINDIEEERICLRCEATSNVWRRGPDDSLLCNACGLEYKKLLKIFNGIHGESEYNADIDPFSFTTSVFMAGVYFELSDLKLILLAFFSIPIDKENVFTFNNNGIKFITDGDSFSIYDCSNCPLHN
ncbi:expressed protein [Dictyostelium purpureum]|uniref:Expressed protein n=1 Tax=Dictyostelium purpureum TaxID=5786 RepID=F0ZHL9_DICPU|nr:uncharacterized protein DICPUDRAFT_97542 [Dictyostelium purpureum]EGC36539.1 expressed protein [Dictyostelium purpureum]|eukprot:XP_003286911.1 expressed protein [Dictyostelium purpureum]